MSQYKPYPAYKDSGVNWLGNLPEHWGKKRGKYLFELARRQANDSDGIVTAFRDGQVTLRTNRRTEGFTNAIKEIGYQGVRKNDLVIHAMDAFAGAIGVSDSDGKCSPVYSCCIPKKDVSSSFYARLVRTMAVTGYIESLAKGIRERSTDFRWSDFSAQLLPIPPIEEQTIIVRYLDRETTRIDALVNAKERFIELLREKRQALITHAVTKGLDPNVKMKDSGVEWLRQVPAHWKVKPVKYLAKHIGSGKTPSGGAEVYQDSGVMFLRSQNVYDDGLRLDDVAYISEAIDREMKASRVYPGDVLLNITGGSIGRSCLAPNDIGTTNVNQHVCIIRAKTTKDARWLAECFVSAVIKKQIEFVQTGAGREGLNFEQIGNMIVPLPPVFEQEAIINSMIVRTARIDDLITKTERSINLLKERRSALITAAVTGQIDLREVE